MLHAIREHIRVLRTHQASHELVFKHQPLRLAPDSHLGEAVFLGPLAVEAEIERLVGIDALLFPIQAHIPVNHLSVGAARETIDSRPVG